MPRHEEGFFSAKDNLRLFWESDVPDRPKAHVGIVHGYFDHAGRYRKFIDALVAEGFAAYAFDYRGHGQADGRRGYCDHFSDYVDDLDVFWARVRGAAKGQKSFLLGHSHGGLMAIHYQARRPAGMAGVMLSSPYLRLALRPPPLKVLGARLIGKVIPWFPVKNQLRSDQLTRDVEAQRAVERDHLYNHTVTPRWFTESTLAQEQAMAMASSFSAPAFVFWGSNDPIASPQATRLFFDRLASSDKEFKEYPGRVHETLNDVGKEEVWKDIANWISKHL